MYVSSRQGQCLTYDAVSNVLSVVNGASVPQRGKAGGQMAHTNTYVSIKYEVETIDKDAIINMVYQIFDTGVTINFIWFAINTIIILGLYIKLRRK